MAGPVSRRSGMRGTLWLAPTQSTSENCSGKSTLPRPRGEGKACVSLRKRLFVLIATGTIAMFAYGSVATGQFFPVPQPDPSCPPGQNTIFGTDGNDVRTGTPANDVMFAGEGDDVFEGEAGDDCLILGTGIDTGNGGEGADRVIGSEG